MKSAYPDQRGVKSYRTEEKTEADANVKVRGIASDLIRVAAEDVLLRPMEEPLPLIFDEKAELVRKKGKVFVVVDEVSWIFSAALLEETDPVLWTGDKGDIPDVVRKGRFDGVLLVYRRLGSDLLKVLRTLKAPWPQILVIVAAFDASDEMVMEVFQAGVRECLIGNVEEVLVIERMTALLEIAGAQREPWGDLFLNSGRGASEETSEAKGVFVDRHDTHHSRIQKALVFIHKEYKRKLSLDEIVKAACMSRRHFSGKFREVMGTSPMDYVKRVRIGEAKLRLIQRGCSIAEAALEVGFSDVSYFHRVFKQLEGMPPAAYHKKVMGE